MDRNSEERAIALNEYIAEIGATVHNAAMRFGISKSTVHKDIPKIAGTFYGKSTIFLPGGVLV